MYHCMSVCVLMVTNKIFLTHDSWFLPTPRQTTTARHTGYDRKQFSFKNTCLSVSIWRSVCKVKWKVRSSADNMGVSGGVTHDVSTTRLRQQRVLSSPHRSIDRWKSSSRRVLLALFRDCLWLPCLKHPLPDPSPPPSHSPSTLPPPPTSHSYPSHPLVPVSPTRPSPPPPRHPPPPPPPPPAPFVPGTLTPTATHEAFLV